MENGRTYHNWNGAKYFLPNDEKEKERLDALYYLFGLTFKGELFTYPFFNKKR